MAQNKSCFNLAFNRVFAFFNGYGGRQYPAFISFKPSGRSRNFKFDRCKQGLYSISFTSDRSCADFDRRHSGIDFFKVDAPDTTKSVLCASVLAKNQFFALALCKSFPGRADFGGDN